MARLLLLVRGSIAVKLTLTLVGFVALTTTVAGLYLRRSLEAFAVDAVEARLATSARLLHDDTRALLARGTSASDMRAFALRSAGPTGARVTVIAPDGRVLGDSEIEVADLTRVENHAGRPEVRAALAGRQGRDLRVSGTLGTPLLYVAVPVADGGRVTGVLRLALPLATVSASYGTLHRVMLAGGLVALVAAFGIGIFVAGRVTRPVVEMQAIARQMSEGRFDVRAPVRSADEIGALGRALNAMAARLGEKLEDVAREQAKATAILDGMVEGVIAVDSHEMLLFMNEPARRMFGVTTGRAAGKPFQEIVRNADLHEIFRRSRAAGEGGASQHELRLLHPVDRWLQINVVPLSLGDEGAGVVMVAHDVTELRRLEQVRTEFIANVSHELRTPLTAIQGYLETLLGGAIEDRTNARRFLEIAFRHTERLGRLLNDLTDLSNIELGRVTLALDPVALGDVVDSTFALVRGRADAGRLTLTAEIDPPGLSVCADHDRLAQILINLVDNAVKYTPEGGRVTVRGRQLAGARAEVEVRDTGVGIPPADLPRITERFYRVDKARSRELGGTGLGLAIVKHLVLAHGGELVIESEPERGTTVRIVLPTNETGSAAQLPLPLGV